MQNCETDSKANKRTQQLPDIGTLIEKRRLNFVNKLLDVPRLARLVVWLSLCFYILILLLFDFIF